VKRDGERRRGFEKEKKRKKRIGRERQRGTQRQKERKTMFILFHSLERNYTQEKEIGREAGRGSGSGGERERERGREKG